MGIGYEQSNLNLEVDLRPGKNIECIHKALKWYQFRKKN